MNLDGPVRAADTAGSGGATVTLSFPAWVEGHVAPTTHIITVLPPKAGPKTEPVAANLVASLIHQDRKAAVWGVQFSSDDQRLFTSAYPSGIIQIWDWAAKRVVRRIDTPPGYRSSSEYALISPDWKTLYVPVEKRTVKMLNRDGKRLTRLEYAGEIRVWDLTTGKEKNPLESAEGTAPTYGKLSPSGRFLISIEQPGYESGQVPDYMTVVWNLENSKKWKLCDGFAVPAFSPDGKTVAAQVTDMLAKTSVVKLLDIATGKELAKLNCPEKDRSFSLSGFSPDGSQLAISLGGKLGAPLEIWFRDGKTLADRGRFIGGSNPKGYGWGSGSYSPDGRHYVVLDNAGKAQFWDNIAGKISCTLDIGTSAGQLAFSPDGTMLAVGWAPKRDEDLDDVRDPDPRDLPQPRVTLFNLAGKNPPRVFMAPQGYAGKLLFSHDGKTLAFGSAGAVHLFDLTK